MHRSPHKWGVFRREFSHRTGLRSERLISRHKTEVAAKTWMGSRPDVYARRLTARERNP